MQASRQLQMMGTVIDILIESDQAPVLLDLVQERLEEWNHIFSANDSNSVLSCVNQAAGQESVSVPPILYHLIKRGWEESLDSNSNLNIAIGPVAQTWRIGFSDARLPTEEAIDTALSMTDPAAIELDDVGETVFLRQSGMKLDLGALAKGYFADMMIQELEERGVASAMINLGGNVLVMGPNPNREDGLWYIGIQNPQAPRGQYVGVLKIANQSVVTSGIYERQLEVAGRVYHHIFDKKTGYPIESDMASLTIVADSSLECEVWTTKLFGKSSLEAYQLIEGATGIEGIVITKDGRLAVTSGLRERFILG